MSETLTRRERREQQRRHRQRRTTRGPSPIGTRRISGIWIAVGVVVLAAVAVFVAMQTGVIKTGRPSVDVNTINPEPGEVVGTKFPDEGNSHLNSGQKATYNQNPPTSGSHWSSVVPPAPVPWGIKDVEAQNEQIVHNLEHGGVVVFWKGLDPNDLDKLKDLVRLLNNAGFRKIVLEPYAGMNDARIAISAWNWQIKLPGYDQVAIVKFVKAHYSGPDAPERDAQ